MKVVASSQEVIIIPEKIPPEKIVVLANPLLKIIRNSFEDPEFVKEYEAWKLKRK